METQTTITVDTETKKLVKAAKKYRGQTYDELLHDVFSGVPDDVISKMTEAEEPRS